MPQDIQVCDEDQGGILVALTMIDRCFVFVVCRVGRIRLLIIHDHGAVYAVYAIVEKAVNRCRFFGPEVSLHTLPPCT